MGSNWLIQCMSVSRPIHTALFFSFKRLNIPFTTSTLFFPTTTTTSSARFSSFPSPSASANLDNGKVGKVGLPQLDVLKQKMELLGIICTHSCVPGHYYNLLCPKCKGGQSMERSLSLHIEQNGDFAMWRCFRFDCGWAGRAFADDQATRDGVHKKVTSTGNMTEKSLGLVPLDDKAIAYFRERMISEETLHRNGVMRLLGDKERGTEKVLYGLDDIVDADEIIIVEGELDKLSMEEAGFRNCVSVPAGAPTKVSNKLPSSSKDTAYQYLQNCKTYLDKVSRIILATDGDAPGQALAEELARRLGKDRCWQVRWPEKDEYSCFKDANEVLKYKGPDALKKVIESAKLYRSSIEDQVTEGI
ncbi:primase homolog protein isoform X4 [Ziziphus jujuba]|uniref:Primase homolog protein isoform X4 n=1 Tax=Ziziphus jujuba TaxID=326968 RepID=A0ABM3I8S8_ZIZJJ|nr:primase homolog protein isoform X4 [Ziziphus jujuba]